MGVWSGRAVLHADMDAFYAAVEVLDEPSLAGCPVIVGGRPEARGVVAAASYEARRYGVRSAMSMAGALRLCPEARVLPPRFSRYTEISGRLRRIMERFTPLVEPLALDEAFLDVTASQTLLGPAPEIARQLKQAIREETGLTASIGVAPNKFLAKVASDIDKPDGFRLVPPEAVDDFLDPLPIGRLWGVGPAAGRRLQGAGVTRIGHLKRLPPAEVERVLGRQGLRLVDLAWGRDERPVVPDREARSISHETTFPEDIVDDRLLEAWLGHLAEQVAWRLRRAGRKGRRVQIKVRFADFRTVTRVRTLARATDLSHEIRDMARALFRSVMPGARPPVRLLGVCVGGLGQCEAVQPDLFSATESERAARVDRLIDEVRGRFGSRAITRGWSPFGGREESR
ncbi:MAG: DNA polymerase IV [Gammaproteobacteria bacterium]